MKVLLGLLLFQLEWKGEQSNFFFFFCEKTKFPPRCCRLRTECDTEIVPVWEIRLSKWLTNIFAGMPLFHFSLLRNVSIILLKWAWPWIPLFRSPECKCDLIHCLNYIRCFFGKIKGMDYNYFQDSLYLYKGYDSLSL